MTSRSEPGRCAPCDREEASHPRAAFGTRAFDAGVMGVIARLAMGW